MFMNAYSHILNIERNLKTSLPFQCFPNWIQTQAKGLQEPSTCEADARRHHTSTIDSSCTTMRQRNLVTLSPIHFCSMIHCERARERLLHIKQRRRSSAWDGSNIRRDANQIDSRLTGNRFYLQRSHLLFIGPPRMFSLQFGEPAVYNHGSVCPTQSGESCDYVERRKNQYPVFWHKDRLHQSLSKNQQKVIIIFRIGILNLIVCICWTDRRRRI